MDAVEYAAPAWLQAVAALTCFVGGISISALLASGLGDPTWSISSGIGALFAAAIFEVGRPARLTVQEAQQLEMQWQDFGGFVRTRQLVNCCLLGRLRGVGGACSCDC